MNDSEEGREWYRELREEIRDLPPSSFRHVHEPDGWDFLLFKDAAGRVYSTHCRREGGLE